MKYDFDKVTDRKGTSTYKYEFCDYYFGKEDILPLWVADMDIETPRFIMDQIRKRAEHNILGYTIPNKKLIPTVAAWVKKMHGWEVAEDWLKFMPGVLPSIAMALDVFTSPKDKVIIQSPIYPPFISIPKANKRTVVFNELKRVGEGYVMDIEDFERKAQKGASAFILCNPHNPAGIVWKKEDLVAIADICYKHKILVVSDEIHCDLVHPGAEHIPFATVSRKAKDNSITLMAPSKTFNMAGLGASFCIVPNGQLRKKYYEHLNAMHVSYSNMFAYNATMAAFTHGEEWLKQLKVYLRGNFDFALDYIKEHIPMVKAFDSQASFLLWLDFSALGLEPKELKTRMVQDGKIGMNNGSDFGPGGGGFQRLNLGAPRSVIHEALQRIEKVVNKLNREL